MPVFAVAFIWTDFPKYDRMEVTPEKAVFYDRDTAVYEHRLDFMFPHILMFPYNVGLRFVEAQDESEAIKKVFESFPRHIEVATAVAVPKGG